MPHAYIDLLSASLKRLEAWRQSYGPEQIHPSLVVPDERLHAVIAELVERLEGNYPFHHPAYAGQMLKPPHPAAWLAYSLAMTINPNNHALDGGPPTSALEKEVINDLAAAFGFPAAAMGHLTGGGTMANLEALWVARQSHPGKAIAYSQQAHYTHSRMCEVLGVEGIGIATDAGGRMHISALEAVADRIGTVVVTLGSTGLGSVDPLAEILPFCRSRGIRVHLDAAYGGFFYLLRDELPHSADWAALPGVDSLVVDPHKHGLQPYGCGAVLFTDPAVGRFYLHDSPYTYFSSAELHLGEISLECSRAGAAAAAFWTTLQLFPLVSHGGLGEVLRACRLAAVGLHKALQLSPLFEPLVAPTLDIVVYYPVAPGLEAVSAKSQAIFHAGMQGPPEQQLHLSLYKVQNELFRAQYPAIELPAKPTTVLRSVLLKPEHLPFVPELVRRLEHLYAVTT